MGSFTWDAAEPLARGEETAKAHAALRDYARLGPERSISKLHRRYTEDTPSGEAPTVHERTLRGWSSKYDWQARVAAWDTIQQDRLDDELWAERRRKLREDEWTAGDSLMSVAQELAEGLDLFKVTSRDVEELPDGTVRETITVQYRPSLQQVATALDTSSKLKRRAADESESKIALTGSALDSAIERFLRLERDDDRD